MAAVAKSVSVEQALEALMGAVFGAGYFSPGTAHFFLHAEALLKMLPAHERQDAIHHLTELSHALKVEYGADDRFGG